MSQLKSFFSNGSILTWGHLWVWCSYAGRSCSSECRGRNEDIELYSKCPSPLKCPSPCRGNCSEKASTLFRNNRECVLDGGRSPHHLNPLNLLSVIRIQWHRRELLGSRLWWQWWPLPGASWHSQSELQWPNECHHLPVNQDRYHYATEDWEIVSEALGESFLWSSQNRINRPFHRREAHHAGIWRLLRRRIVSVIPILYAICCCMFCHPANE